MPETIQNAADTQLKKTLRALIRDVPDFPSPGIMFRDITPLLADPTALRAITAALVERYQGQGITKIIGIESRGFIFGAPLAAALGVGFVPARKPGKLPYQTIDECYTLEYGSNTICLHIDAVMAGEKVIVVDDLIATGGTLGATCRLVERLGGEVVEIAAIIELGFLKGRDQLGGRPIYTLIQY